MRRRSGSDQRPPARSLIAGLAGLLMWAWPGPGAAQVAAGPATPGAVSVAVDGGRLSLEAHKAPLEEVLRAIARAAGFDLALSGPLEATGSWTFTDLPLEVGLMRLLDKNSSVMLFGPGESGGSWVLTEVRVLSPGAGTAGPEDQTNFLTAAAPVDEPAGALGDLAGPREARRLAVQRLANRPRVREAQRLAALLRTDEDPMIRRIAAVGLGRIATPEARLALDAALADENEFVRRRAAESLGRVGDSQALAPLHRVLLEDPDPEVRRSAALALGRLRRLDSVDTLVTAQSDSDPSVRQAATAALARLEQQGLVTEE